MLPGLRFLFVAIVLSMSMLIFGLGAAALLRSAHEEFASLPNRRAQPEPVFAQPVETTRPTLALLRVDTPPGQSNPDRSAAPPEQPSSSAAEPEKSAEPEKLAALNTAAPSEEKPKPADQPTEPSAEAPASIETPARAETAVPPLEVQAAAIETTATAEPSSLPADASAKAAAMNIATLGGPEVTIDPKAASKTPLATSGKRAQTRPRIKRRRIVRPRIVPPKPVTLGFFEPLPVPDRPTRQN
jgi:cytoskeletal protein RodZ